MTDTAHLVTRLPNDIGGQSAEPIQRVEHELEPWEKRCHALADVLDFHKIINSYYERWIVAFSNILFRKEILTPTELALKMEEVDARWDSKQAAGDAGSAHPS
jgi:hypothetical protein